jgi:hypothetical protein
MTERLAYLSTASRLGLALLVLGAPACDSPAPSPASDAPGSVANAGDAVSATNGADAPGEGDGADGSWCKAKQVFDEYCVSCHDGQGTAGTPMALKTHADLVADSALYPGTKVFARALERMKAGSMRMPPQGSVPADKLALIEAWTQAGAPSGSDPTCGGASAAAPQSAPSWPAACEKFYKFLAHDMEDSDQPYRVAAGSEPHPQFVFDAPWDEEEVQALAFRPVTDNKRVLHHWILYQHSGGAFLSGWAPGQDAAKRSLPDDVGMFLPSGTQSLRLDLHYNNLLPDAQEELDASGVEICVVSKPNFRPNTATVFMGFMAFAVPMAPANTVNHELTRSCSVTASSPVHLLSTSPHAHKLATHAKFTVQKRDGMQVVMHDEPFDFSEQVSKGLPQELVLETGDTVTTTCTYTNTTGQDVLFGEDTGDEMCFNFAAYYPKGALRCDPLGELLGSASRL